MYFNFSYDMCAVVLLLSVLCLHYLRKPTPILQNKIFSCLIWIVVLTTVTDCICALSAVYRGLLPKPLVLLCGRLYLYTFELQPLCTVAYIVSYAHTFERYKSRNRSLRLKLFLIIPFICTITAVTVMQLHYQSAAENFPAQAYAGTPLQRVLDVLHLYCIGMNAFLLLQNKKKDTWLARIAPMLFFVPAVIGSVIQKYMPGQLTMCFGISVSLLLAAVFAQKPENHRHSITGLFNKTAFTMMINQSIRRGKPFYIIGIIIDEQPFLNAAYETPFINSILKKAADYLNQIPDSTAYRINQRTFCLEIPVSSNDEKTPAYIADIIDTIENRFMSLFSTDDGRGIYLSVRQCIIAYPRDIRAIIDGSGNRKSFYDAESIAGLIDIAATDQRYQQIKRIPAQSIDISIHKRNLYIEHAIKTAIQEDRLSVYYQPIFSIQEQKIIGAEALIRLKDRAGNFISPEEFIPIAEHNGSILSIGEYVFEQVCRFLKATDLQLYNIQKIDVNLSIVQCRHPQIVEQILTIIQDYQTPTHVLNLEITETAAATSYNMLQDNMQQLVMSGIELSLDDYGSGYSNLNYLLSFPFKMIKLDKEIIWKAFKDKKAEIVLASTISMIRALNMTVLAEGVETKDQVDWLSGLGCDYLQGFYYSKPLPEAGFLSLLRKINMHEQAAAKKAAAAKADTGTAAAHAAEKGGAAPGNAAPDPAALRTPHGLADTSDLVEELEPVEELESID